MLPIFQKCVLAVLDITVGRIISLNSIKRPLSTKVKIAGNSAGVVASGNSTKTFSSAVFSSLDNLTVGLAKLM